MQPWMIFALLFAAGLVALLVAPRVHRRSTQKSLAAARMHKQERVAQLRRAASVVETPMSSEQQAIRARDALLLRGVRSEVASNDLETVLVSDASDEEIVSEVLSSLEGER